MTRRLWSMLFLAALAVAALPAMALGAEDEDFDPALEFQLDPYVSIEVAGIDMSINKAVLYLIGAGLICIVAGLLVVRRGLSLYPRGLQNFVEMAYEFSEQQIARPTLPDKNRTFQRYFPFIATLFLFLAVSNIFSFIPFPVSHETGFFPLGIPDLGLYAATANINVTLALTIVVFLVTHVEGVRAHGPGGYVKTLIPDAPGAIKPVIFVLEILSQLLRLVSLSVRLFANLLVGHLLIIVSAGFVLLIGSLVGVVAIPVGVFFYVFEWTLIAGLQAFIFAMLSGIYIGFAVDAPH
ncbi:MAG: F0F1 ATP synthase subunit A [Miltoncostaeaceae bacterium]